MNRLPLLLSQIGEVPSLPEPPTDGGDPGALNAWFLVLDGLIRSTVEGIGNDLRSAYRRGPDGAREPALELQIDDLSSSALAYVSEAQDALGSGMPGASYSRNLDQYYSRAIDKTMAAWVAVQTRLEGILRERITGLSLRLWGSLAIVGVLAAVSILIAIMMHRHFTQPLQRLEAGARNVRKTRDYSVRATHMARDVGQLSAAFNRMMNELAAARERESAEQLRIATLQAELARATRLTTMGEIAAMIAHEIKQPLAAIVRNGGAGLRWLASPSPNVEEANAALQRRVRDGHRASQVITSIRAMPKKARVINPHSK